MRSVFLMATFALVSAAPAAAQDACGYIRQPEIGGWSSYQIGETEKNVKGGMKLAVIARENRGGTPMHRLEMTMSDKAGKEQMTMQLLVPGWPYEGGAVEEMIMQPAGKAPMKVGGPMLGMMRTQAARNGGMSAAKHCETMELVGRESVTVPGGTFETEHFRDTATGTELWATREVPFGFVKTVDKDGNSMVLTGHGTGAESVITGTPQVMGG